MHCNMVTLSKSLYSKLLTRTYNAAQCIVCKHLLALPDLLTSLKQTHHGREETHTHSRHDTLPFRSTHSANCSDLGIKSGFHPCTACMKHFWYFDGDGSIKTVARVICFPSCKGDETSCKSCSRQNFTLTARSPQLYVN